MQSAKEKAANVAASAKSGMEKTKATVQGKAETLTSRDPVKKQVAEQKKEERMTRAELEKQAAREYNAASRQSGGTHGYTATGAVDHGGGTYGTATGTTGLDYTAAASRQSGRTHGYTTTGATDHGGGTHGSGADYTTGGYSTGHPTGRDPGDVDPLKVESVRVEEFAEKQYPPGAGTGTGRTSAPGTGVGGRRDTGYGTGDTVGGNY